MKQTLSDSLRPKNLDDVVGQDHLIGRHGLIRKVITSSHPLSILLWGPPGCGKTTIARLYAQSFSYPFFGFSAVSNSIGDVKKIIEDAQKNPLFKSSPLIFIDELHRFNKAQQDLFLPFIEKGIITLIGATTENPSFAINNALISRLRVFELKPLSQQSLDKIISRFEKTESHIILDEKIKKALIEIAQGDARHLINTLENLNTTNEGHIDIRTLYSSSLKRPPFYDKGGDFHYNLISAFHKSIRGSDPDTSIYWLARMLNAGEDPHFIGRRLTRIASEDVGLADPNALSHTLAAWDVFTRLGSPEGELALAQATIYLALAPKSNALYQAYKNASVLSAKTTHLSPPKIILNAPTTFMKQLNYGKGYIYDHDTKEGVSGQNYFPDEMERTKLYHPVNRGFEREMKKRLEYFNQFRKAQK